jgi:hypothetical protein
MRIPTIAALSGVTAIGVLVPTSEALSVNFEKVLRGHSFCSPEGEKSTYNEDGSYLIAGFLNNGRSFERRGQWRVLNGNLRRINFDDGDDREDSLTPRAGGAFEIMTQGGHFIGGKPRTVGRVAGIQSPCT